MSTDQIRATAAAALEHANCSAVTPARVDVLTKHLALVDGSVAVVDADGEVRTRPDMLGKGDRPMTLIELMREILTQPQHKADARVLRWKPAPWVPQV